METRQIAPILQDKQLTMSSREIAELTGKRHDHVMRDIRNMLEELGVPNFGETSYLDSQGKKQPEYRLPKREMLILASGYSIKLRARLVDRWQELENTVTAKAIIGNMVKNCAGLVIKEELQNLIPALVEPLVKSRSLENNILIRHGKTAGEIWASNRLPRLKNAAVWLGNRLSEMGCAVEGNARAEFGNRAVRLFDPDKSNICLRNGLLHTAKLYASERQGQGKLRLIKSSHEENKP